jgi:phosphoenolpyruvate-protein kinase (PTS system EI component)
MIETPAAALIADRLAPLVDFFSIGSNDLVQYSLAVDRNNPTVAALADPFHPAVLRLFRLVIEAAHAAGRWVGICGELAAEPLAVPLLVGLGFDELSIGPAAIPTIKAAIRRLSAAACQQLAEATLAQATAADVRRLLSER